MADAKLSILLQADTSSVEQAVQKVQNDLIKLRYGSTELSSSLKGNLNPAIEKSTISLKEQTAILRSLQVQYASLSTEAAKSPFGKELAEDIKTAKQEVARLSAGSQNFFQQLGLQGRGGFGSIINQLRQIAYILPGIGVAGIFSGIFSALSDLVGGLGNTKNAFDTATASLQYFKTQLEDLDKSVQDAKKNLDFSIQLDKLQNQLKHGTGTGTDILNLKDENKLIDNFVLNTQNKIDKLQADLKRGEQLINISDLHVKPGSDFGKTISELPDAYISSLPKGLQNLVNAYKSTYDEIQKLQNEQDAALNNSVINDVQIKLKQAEQERKLTEDIKKALDEQNKAYADSIKYRNDLSIHDANKIANNEYLQIGLRTAALQKIDDLEKSSAEAQATYQIQAIQRTEDELKRQGLFSVERAKADADKIENINQQLALKKISIEEETAKKISQLQSKSLLNPDAGVLSTSLLSSDIDKLKSERDKINSDLLNLVSVSGAIPGLGTDKQIASLKEELSVIDKIIEAKSKEITITAPTATKGETNLAENIQLFRQYEQEFQRFGDIGQKAFDRAFNSLSASGTNIKNLKNALQNLELFKKLNNEIANGLSQAFNSVFEAILSGKNAFQALGQAIQQLVVQLIEAVVQMLIIKAIENAIFPGSSIGIPGLAHAGALPGRASGGPVSGGSAYIIGESGPEIMVPNSNGYIFPNSFLSGLTKFADGGFISSSTSALVGENGPELFIPSLNSSSNYSTPSMRSSGSNVVQVVVKGKMRGNDIVLSQARTNRLNNYNV